MKDWIKKKTRKSGNTVFHVYNPIWKPSVAMETRVQVLCICMHIRPNLYPCSSLNVNISGIIRARFLKFSGMMEVRRLKMHTCLLISDFNIMKT